MSSTLSRDRIAAWIVFAVMLVVTIAATKYVWDNSRMAERARFDREVASAQKEIETRVETYINVLIAASGLFAADQDVTRDQFRQYVRALQVQQRYPGIQGIGISVRVPAELHDDVIADMRINESPAFRFWPEGRREEYHAIVLLEPMDRRNRAALGYDMFTEPTRREAMVRARDNGRPTATQPVTLVQEIEPQKQPGFLIYVPVYTTRGVPSSVEERREELYGFVYAPFRSWDFFRGIFPGTRMRLGISIRDAGKQLFSSGPSDNGPRTLASQTTLDVAGRKWTIDFVAPPTGLRSPLRAAAATFAGGLLFALLLFRVIRLQSRARRAAEQTAEALRRSEGELQKAARAKDEFLATLSHELRTPMTAILGWSKLLDDDLDEETRRSAVEAIQKSGKAQAQLIDDLLDVSRITSGKMRIEPKPTDLVPIARAALDAVAPAAEAKGVAIDFEPAAEKISVRGDANRLQQVIWNLLSNAVKFTSRGGRVRLTVSASEREAVLAVTDSGQGIDPAFLPHVFERFRQADSSTTRSHTGLGLGLAIVRHLVELHGGTVMAESDGIGKGARFTARLPLLDGDAQHVPESRDEHAAATSLREARVLVIDDEEDVRNYAGAVFRMSGADVKCVRSAADAIEALQRWKPDVIVSDLGMPERDGFDLLRELRSSEATARIPVVALTAYARPEDREAAERAGFNAFVAKPADPTRLRVAVAEVISQPKT